jgi:hypothetical protein
MKRYVCVTRFVFVTKVRISVFDCMSKKTTYYVFQTCFCVLKVDASSSAVHHHGTMGSCVTGGDGLSLLQMLLEVLHAVPTLLPISHLH